MNQPTTAPLVSIALATYNGQAYLPELLDSLFAQTYTNIEVIVVDDISRDDTLSILNMYSEQHANMKVYVNESNLGYVKNFEKAISLCAGDFIAPCDQDDKWLPDKLKRKVEKIGTFPMIYCDSLIADENMIPTGKKVSDAVVCRTYTSCLNYAVYANVYGHASLFTRALYQSASGFPVCIPHDWWLVFNATLQGGVVYLPEALIIYRQHPNNLFGIVGGKRKEHHRHDRERDIRNARSRIELFCNTCHPSFTKEKEVLQYLKKSYESFSLPHNLLRMFTFFANYKTLLAVKKRNTFRKLLFCCKMFVKLK